MLEKNESIIKSFMWFSLLKKKTVVFFQQKTDKKVMEKLSYAPNPGYNSLKTITKTCSSGEKHFFLLFNFPNLTI